MVWQRRVASLSLSLSLAFFWLPAALAWSQTTAAGEDFTYTISTSQAWTDTGLDLQSGDVLQISSSAAPSGCDPRGASGAAQTTALPLPSAPAGALIARLHAHGASPLLVASGAVLHIAVLHIKEPSHLFLGVNIVGEPPCRGAFSVAIHRVAAGSSPAETEGSTAAPSASEAAAKPRGEQLRSQLGTAAQIFLQGQFGAGQPAASANDTNGGVSGGSGEAGSGETTTSVPVLQLSDVPLDPELSKDIDGLPRRVNDQFKNLGDMVNFVIVGSQKIVQAALDAATWHVADTNNKKAVLSALMETYQNKDYLQMPMSTLYLFGRPQDFGYEMAEPIAMVASRHHFRIWKAPFTWNGQEVWVGAGTHDIGFAKDKRNGTVTHKIDPLVDGERDNIGGSLQKASKVKSLTYYLPPDPVQGAKNATGDGYQSDGRLLIIVLE
jgi:hypothetical protein